MYFPQTPRVELQSSEDVFDLLVVEEEQTEIKNQFCITNKFFQLSFQNRFFQLVEPTSQELEEDE